MAHKVL